MPSKKREIFLGNDKGNFPRYYDKGNDKLKQNKTYIWVESRREASECDTARNMHNIKASAQ